MSKFGGKILTFTEVMSCTIFVASTTCNKYCTTHNFSKCEHFSAVVVPVGGTGGTCPHKIYKCS